jgi:serine/threonine protein kinase
VHLERVAVSKKGVFLVFEYCQHDLADVVDAYYSKFHTSPFPEAACKTLLQHLLSAFVFLHQHSILHRDLKLSNLLFSKRGTLKLAGEQRISLPFWYNEGNHLSSKLSFVNFPTRSRSDSIFFRKGVIKSMLLLMNGLLELLNLLFRRILTL